MPPRERFEIVVECSALAVADGFYALDEARLPLRLGAYALKREAQQQLVALARAEAERRGLALDPWYLPRHELVGARGETHALRLIRPKDVRQPSAGRPWLAIVRVRRIEEGPSRWTT
jgi:hypothetical protein